MLSEIIKYNGNVENALNDSQAQKNTSFNFDKIRELINGSSDDNNKTETIKLNRPKS